MPAPHASHHRRHPLPPPGTVTPAHVLQWLTKGWQLFLLSPGRWAVMTLIFIVIIAALGVVPLIGWAAAPVALPVLVAGLVAGADALSRGEALRVDHVFDGLRRHAGNLLLVGGFHLLGALIAALVAAAVGGSAMMTGMMVGTFAGMGMAAGGMMLGVLVFSLLWGLLMMALCFAPALVMLQDVSPLDAMKLSAQACFHNLLTFLVLGVIMYILAWVAMLPAGLGVFVLIPVFAGTLHAAWRDTFSPLHALPAHLAHSE
ncbi:hypothetical protein J5J83_10215 [Azoarcus sp. L1K30]|uniref:BPSS1780 family membrane protein n=1 Tax=Azoarcus sp. L1K30 TaxID=2820277 RepID=UPI001B84170B|nr:BPSS1780 family membrane protein [Azoarcus sp. L1K30]MBR0566489.1 hypothetical protein [Azoarcus sp. L1K30]